MQQSNRARRFKVGLGVEQRLERVEFDVLRRLNRVVHCSGLRKTRHDLS